MRWLWLWLSLLIAEPLLAQTRTVTTVLWRTSASNAAGYVDSIYFSHGATSVHADTTAPIELRNFALPPIVAATATADSSTWFALYFSPATVSGINPGADTLAIQTQVSLDAGSTWTKVNPPVGGGPARNGLQAGGDTLLVSAAAPGYEQPLGTNTFFFAWPIRISSGSLAFNTAGTFPDYTELYGYRQIRWVVQSDATGAFKAEIVHWK